MVWSHPKEGLEGWNEKQGLGSVGSPEKRVIAQITAPKQHCKDSGGCKKALPSCRGAVDAGVGWEMGCQGVE